MRCEVSSVEDAAGVQKQPADNKPRPFLLTDELRDFINTMPTLAWACSSDGSAEFFNQRWLEYTGLSADQALGWGWKVVIHPDDLPRMLEILYDALKLGEPFEVEGRLRRFDGEFRWFLVRACPLLDESGQVVRWYGTNTDLEERKRAEDALRISEQNFRLIVDGIPAPTVTFTAKGEVEYANQRTLDYTGWTLERLRHWAPLIHPDDLKLVRKSCRHSIETGQPFEVEPRIRGADGVFRWFVARSIPGRNTEGRIIRWYAILFDIDVRKKTEEKLRRSEWNLLEAQRLGHSGSWSLDVASGIVSSSPEMLRVVDPQPGEDYMRPDFWFNRIHPEDRNRVREHFERCVREKIDYQADFRVVVPDGTIKYHHSIGYPILNESGDLVEFVGTAIDVTEQVKARIELEKALEKVKIFRDRLYRENKALRDELRLEERVNERTRIARDLHDTLLQNLHGLMFRFQAARNMLPRSPQEAMEALDGAIMRTEQAIEQSQDAIANLRSERVTTTYLEEMLSETGRELGTAGDTNGDPPIFRVIVEGERQALSPVLHDEVYRISCELLRNAFRHARAHHIEAEIRYANDILRVRIRDDGKGMDPRILKEGRRPGHWGLPGVRERALQVGAKLHFWSEAGVGTEVQLTVPAAIAYRVPGDRT